MKNINNKYEKQYSEKNLWNKIQTYAKAAGHQVVYTALLLFYAYRRSDTPKWAKSVILGALGYFIAPIDAIPDLSPIIGYTDDFGVLTLGLVTIAAYVNDEVKTQARNKLKSWFGTINDKDLQAVEDKLKDDENK